MEEIKKGLKYALMLLKDQAEKGFYPEIALQENGGNGFKPVTDALDKLNDPDVLKIIAVDLKEAYKECFEEFIPTERWDEANEFLSTYGCGLSKDIAIREK